MKISFFIDTEACPDHYKTSTLLPAEASIRLFTKIVPIVLDSIRIIKVKFFLIIEYHSLPFDTPINIIFSKIQMGTLVVISQPRLLLSLPIFSKWRLLKMVTNGPCKHWNVHCHFNLARAHVIHHCQLENASLIIRSQYWKPS